MEHTAVEVLTKARAYVKQGWIQGTARIGNRRCVAQAISDSSIDTWRQIKQEHRRISPNETVLGTQSSMYVHAAIKELYPGYEWLDLPDWNDTTGRTKDEVLHVFDHAIKLAERDAS